MTNEDLTRIYGIKSKPAKPRTRWERFLSALARFVPFWDGDSTFSVRRK